MFTCTGESYQIVTPGRSSSNRVVKGGEGGFGEIGGWFAERRAEGEGLCQLDGCLFSFFGD